MGRFRWTGGAARFYFDAGKIMGKEKGRIQVIGAELCEDFQRLVALPPDKTRGKSRHKPSDQDIKAASEAALKKFYAAADALRRTHRLGLIGRARVAFDLQQRLLAAGYPSPLVKQVLFALLTSAFVGGKR